MKIVLEIDNNKTLLKDDLIIYDGEKKKWKVINKSSFLSNVYQEIANQNLKIKEQNESIRKLKNDTNAVLEKYHKILQTLVKEN